MNNDASSLKAAKANRRILIVGMHTSVHVWRWLDMIDREDAAILVFPVYVHEWNLIFPPNMRHIPLSEVSASLLPGFGSCSQKMSTARATPSSICSMAIVGGVTVFWVETVIAAPGRLRECIARFDPEVLHSMEVQLAGYLCLETARRMRSGFPPWILSNWGSDIALFHKLPEHQPRIREICRRIDYYLAECVRDHRVAREYGYRGPTLPVIPASGGRNVAALAARARVRPSERRKILVKGYHGWSGRALLALSAVALARKHLAGYQIEVSLVGAAVPGWVERMRARK